MMHFLAKQFWSIVSWILLGVLIFCLVYWVYPWAKSYFPQNFKDEVLTVQEIRQIYSAPRRNSEADITTLLLTDKGEYELPSALVEYLNKGDLIKADGYTQREMEYPFIESFQHTKEENR
jgi:hypothetical protein